MRQQGAARFLDGLLVRERSRDVEAGFLGVADDGARAAVSVQARSLGLNEYRNIALMAGVQDAFRKAIVDEAFVVVGENQRVELLQGRKQQTKELLFRLRSEGIAALVVNTDDLLVARDDACLYGGHAMDIGKNAALADLRRTQASTQRAASFVIQQFLPGLFLRGFSAAHDAEDLNVRAERCKI